MNTLQRRIIILFATLMLSVSAILTRYTDADSMGLSFYRMFFSALLTIPIALFVRYRGELGSMDLGSASLCIMSGVILALHFAMFFDSVRYTSVASSLVFINTTVFFNAGIMYLLYREVISKKAVGAIGITFGGSVLIAASDFGGGDMQLWGHILAIIGALLFSFYTIIGAKVRTGMSTALYTLVVYTAAAATAFVICVSGGGDISGFGPVDYGAAFGMALFCTILGQTVYSWGLKYESPTFITVINLGEPVFGALLALVLLSEIPAPFVIAGSVIVLGGMYLFSIHTEGER